MNWKDIIGGVAPGLATALGGPLAGAAVKVIADKVLGKPDASESEVIEALSNGLNGDQILALKQAEQSFLLEMERIDASRDQAVLADTQNARQQTVDLAKTESKIAFAAPVLSAIIIFGFFSCVYLLFLSDVSFDGRKGDLMNVLFGAMVVGFTQVVNYWLGSSAGSKRSGDALRAAVAKEK